METPKCSNGVNRNVLKTLPITMLSAWLISSKFNVEPILRVLILIRYVNYMKVMFCSLRISLDYTSTKVCPVTWAILSSNPHYFVPNGPIK